MISYSLAAISRRCFTLRSVANVFKMSSVPSYEDAVQKLNNLQSNKATIDQIRRDIKTGLKCTNLEDMEDYLMRTGINMKDLDRLSVIHVAGTKGKGSTSAMCESILRSHGYRTGFYSSPHLVSVCERIRLDGLVITKELFTKHFFDVYNKLDGTQKYEGDMPKYFAFLTVLAFNVFLKEKVDVAIIEVGIGGIVDYTNVIRNPPVVGITALGLDHTSILGHTIEEIAEAKAGIMKLGCEAYTVDQPPNAMAVLKRVAEKTKCPLYLVPEYKDYTFPINYPPKLPVDISAYKTNASLAIQIAHAWLRKANFGRIITDQFVKETFKERDKANKFIKTDRDKGEPCVKDIPIKTVNGLSICHWPGRYQVIKSDFAKFYLDGAHTKESLELCASWFIENNGKKRKILIFTSTGDRDSRVLLSSLKSINFSEVYFVIPTTYKKVQKSNDNYSILEHKEVLQRCLNHAKVWKELRENSGAVNVFECIADAFIDIKEKQMVNNDSCQTSVLITGSLHLVGAAIAFLDESLHQNK